MINTPVQPFAEYKWLWASVQPSEGLNSPPVYLGVLRAFNLHNGSANGDSGLLRSLEQVKNDTGTRINLARSGERNLVRNSGQYWKVFGLIERVGGIVNLTNFGVDVAESVISPYEFAAVIIKTLTLPSSAYNAIEVAQWKQCNLQIKPLELILNVLLVLDLGGEAWITVEELTRIVIPLAGDVGSNKSTDAKHISEAVLAYRHGQLSIANWPDCVPKANDKRVAREFLLFLEHYGFLSQSKDRQDVARADRFELVDKESTQVLVTSRKSFNIQSAIKTVQGIDFYGQIIRRRIMASRIARPKQAKFRRDVIASDTRCLISGTTTKEVLEVAHIRPVQYGGDENMNNGLCLRADIHTLFDIGYIKIDDGGTVHLSPVLLQDTTYSNLPKQIVLPRLSVAQAIRWRWRYL